MLIRDVPKKKPANIFVPVRASIRCDCAGCGNHKNRCLHFAGRRVTRTRHPVVMHRIDGRLICHRCLNRRLEIQRRRLYPEIIPDVT